MARRYTPRCTRCRHRTHHPDKICWRCRSTLPADALGGGDEALRLQDGEPR